MNTSKASGFSKGMVLAIAVLFSIVIGTYLIFQELSSPITLESAELIQYVSPELKSNIAIIEDTHYLLVSRKDRETRVGIMNESKLIDLFSTLNSILKEAKPISQEGLDSLVKDKANLNRENLTLISEVRVEFQFSRDFTLIRVIIQEKERLFISSSTSLRDYFMNLHKWSEEQTTRLLNLIRAELREMKENPSEYRISSVRIEKGSNKPIAIVMIWQGCPCEFKPPLTFFFSVEDLLKGKR